MCWLVLRPDAGGQGGELSLLLSGASQGLTQPHARWVLR